MDTNLAIWILVIICGIIAIYLVRFLNQLTKVAQEGEYVLRTLNTRLPALLEHAEKVISKADETVDRLNETLDELEEPIQYIRLATRFVNEAKMFIIGKLSGGLSAIGAGFKTAKAIIAKLLERHKNKEKEPVE